LATEVLTARNTKHGDSPRDKETKEYRTWLAIKQRCHNMARPDFKRYGGRGITVHTAWQGDFQAFLASVGRAPSKNHSLDRINNDGDYEPGNVRWATNAEQARNTRKNRKLTINGVTMVVSDWAKIAGLSYDGFKKRIDSGWPVARLLSPSRNRNKQNRGKLEAKK